MLSPVIFFLILWCESFNVGSLAEASTGNSDAGLSRFQPMVALLCGHGKYHNQYLDENRHWVSDPDTKATCMKDKLEVLEYCRKIYPKKDVRNIVESGRYYKIDRWCKVGQKKCKTSHWVKPYRCLEGPFQSDALLVPEHCLFDHIHNQSVCQTFDEWNHTAAGSCENRNMKLKSFAMLLPCGVDIFSGVEFVCCPKEEGKTSPLAASSENDLDQDGDEEGNDEYDDDEDENYYDNDYDSSSPGSNSGSSTTTSTTTTTTTTTTTERPTTSVSEAGTEKPVDYYFTHFDSKREHDAFKEAQKSLEDFHREKVTKVMKEWSELEERYQEMKIKDPKGAEDFRKKMSSRFQRTVEALEEEGSAEKRQLSAMHQQRVMTIVNLRKKSAMDCYTSALDQTPTKTKKIEKCLEKLLRALEKDRVHTLHHYRHLLASNPKQALKEKEAMLEHLENLHHVANQSLSMLDRAPSVADKIRDRMTSLWHHLHGLGPEEEVTKETDKAILEKYKEEITAKQKEREHRKQIEEERRQELKEQREEKKRVESNMGSLLEREFDSESMEDESTSYSSSTSSSSVAPPPSGALMKDDNSGHEENEEEERSEEKNQPRGKTVKEERLNAIGGNSLLDYPQGNNLPHELTPPRAGHAQKQAFHHNEVTFSVRKEEVPKFKWNVSVYITLAFAGIALLTAMMVGIVLLRRHAQRSSPHSQGFVEVDQAATPEERHVANMQINGYENPTYKYFEAQST